MKIFLTGYRTLSVGIQIHVYTPYTIVMKCGKKIIDLALEIPVHAYKDEAQTALFKDPVRTAQ